MTDDRPLTEHISSLVDEEHALRQRLANGEISAPDEHARLAGIEVELDRCWDLLRQRRAKREFGEDPDAAHTRGADVVERYEG
ncbi:MAG: DUF2630 family protein [Nocardioidaceae bacterium]